MVAPAVVDVVLVVLVVVVVVVVVIVLVYGMLCGTKPKDSCPSNNSTVVGNNSTIIVGIVVTTLCARTNQHKSVGVCQPLASMQRVKLHTMKVPSARFAMYHSLFPRHCTIEIDASLERP